MHLKVLKGALGFQISKLFLLNSYGRRSPPSTQLLLFNTAVDVVNFQKDTKHYLHRRHAGFQVWKVMIGLVQRKQSENAESAVLPIPAQVLQAKSTPALELADHIPASISFSIFFSI